MVNFLISLRLDGAAIAWMLFLKWIALEVALEAFERN